MFTQSLLLAQIIRKCEGFTDPVLRSLNSSQTQRGCPNNICCVWYLQFKIWIFLELIETWNFTSTTCWRMENLFWTRLPPHPDSFNILLLVISHFSGVLQQVAEPCSPHLFVYICFPIRSRERHHVWAQCQYKLVEAQIAQINHLLSFIFILLPIIGKLCVPAEFGLFL